MNITLAFHVTGAEVEDDDGPERYYLTGIVDGRSSGRVEVTKRTFEWALDQIAARAKAREQPQ